MVGALRQNVLFLILGACVLLMAPFLMRPGEDAVAWNRIEMARVLAAISIYQIETGNFPESAAENGSELLWQLTEGSKRPLLEVIPRWREANRLVDSWGTPYRIKIEPLRRIPETDRQEGEIKIWSCGKNRKDENGAGDDILLMIEW